MPLDADGVTLRLEPGCPAAAQQFIRRQCSVLVLRRRVLVWSVRVRSWLAFALIST
jgi:hypothetical protein